MLKQTSAELYAHAKRELAAAGVENPAFEAGCILETRLGLRRHELALRGVETYNVGPVFEDIARRADGEPLQYILGEWDFMGLRFTVGPDVLIPRADTELLAETGLAFIKPLPAPRVLELCTGSGCVAVSLAVLHRGCSVTAVDISEKALSYARKNAAKHGAEGRIEYLRGDMLSGPGAGFSCGYDLLLCNPPYIPRGDIAGLDDSVRCFEPVLALDGGADGLDFYRAARRWFSLLRPGGLAVFEIGCNEGPQVTELFMQAGLHEVSLKKDLAGHDRVVSGFAP